MSALADGNFRDAQKACGRAIKLDRWNPAPYKLRGASYLFEKRYEQARVDFAEATRLDPTDAENHAGYAEAFRGQGKYRDAIAQFSAAIVLAPNDPRMWNARCWTRGAFARELPAGLSDCNRALRLAPEQADVLDSRGLIYLRMGKLDDAARDFSAALRRRPSLATALYGRGVARLKRGDVKGAQADVLGARVADPNVDDNFFWSPLLSLHCLTGIVRDHGWKCRPPKAPARKSPNTARMAVTP
jgi:tetratricopeptide (TPR) repeat protein